MMKRLLKRIHDKKMRLLFKLGGSDYRIKSLRQQGAKIGKDCLILAEDFGTEPYLIELGDHVVVASGTRFINHDGGVWILRDRYPAINVFGRITVGNNSFIGIDCLLLPGTKIGSNCIIGAGAVVRGKIADDSVVMGNPAKVIMKTSFAEKFMLTNKNRVDTKHMTDSEKKQVLLRHFFG